MKRIICSSLGYLVGDKFLCWKPFWGRSFLSMTWVFDFEDYRNEGGDIYSVCPPLLLLPATICVAFFLPWVFVIWKGDYMAHFLPNVGASQRDGLPGCLRRRRERGGSIEKRELRRAWNGFQLPDDGRIDEFVKHIKVRGREGGSRWKYCGAVTM